MAHAYVLQASPTIPLEGAGKPHLQHVHFVATSGQITRVWDIDQRDLILDFRRVTTTLGAEHIVECLRNGESVILPGRFSASELCELGFRYLNKG
jgi:hypothetical protein